MAQSDLQPADWIALRLLYILTASDPSTVSLPDVRKTIEYYESKLGSIQEAFALLNKDIPYDGETFMNPRVKLTRNVKIVEAKDYVNAT